MPLIVTWKHSGHEPAYNNGCSNLPKWIDRQTDRQTLLFHVIHNILFPVRVELNIKIYIYIYIYIYI